MEKAEITEKIVNYIVNELLLGEGQDLSATSNLDGVLDSITVFNLASYIEREFGARIEDEDLTTENFDTVEHVVDMVTAKLA